MCFREKLGCKVLIKTARNESSPKVRILQSPWRLSNRHSDAQHWCLLSPQVSAVSAVVNWGTSPKAFVFRNYNHKPGSLSRYAGGSGCQMWQAVRASSAAPGYFQEFPLQSDIHQVETVSAFIFHYKYEGHILQIAECNRTVVNEWSEAVWKYFKLGGA